MKKTVLVEEVVREMCNACICMDCAFYNPEDATDGEYFCHIRDGKKHIPVTYEWDMHSAMISD